MKTLSVASLFVVFAVLFASAPALAQSELAASPAPAGAEAETLVGLRQAQVARVSGWFLAPTFSTTSFANTLAYGGGLRGGIYLNQRVAVGVAVNGLLLRESHFDDHGVTNAGTYGGLLLQYVVQSNRLLHVTIESTLGSGRWCNSVSDGENGKPEGCSGRTFLAFEPVANVELNVAKHVRVATGVGYRFAVAASGDGPSSRDMSGLVARTSVVFGSF
jgi:hypothetical protein